MFKFLYKIFLIFQNLPCLYEQSTKFCSLRERKTPVLILFCPSKAPVEENAQQDPHSPLKIKSKRFIKLLKYGHK